MPRMSSEAYRRYNEMLDWEFFKTLRLVTHMSDLAMTTVTQLY
jgi:hypothetical protein